MSNLYLKNTHLYYTYWNIIRIFVARFHIVLLWESCDKYKVELRI